MIYRKETQLAKTSKKGISNFSNNHPKQNGFEMNDGS